jgi:hypothetical protein
MKKSFIKIWVLCYVFFGSSLPASAAVLTFIGDFDATFNNPTEGIPNITGNWSFDFDTNSVQGLDGLFTVNLTSLTLSPNLIGTTTFNISNTSGWLQYLNGTLSDLGIGGDISEPFGVSSDTDDFAASYDAAGNASGAVISVASSPLTSDSAPGLQGGSVSGGFSIVPIPPAVWLFSSGILGLIAMAKRRKAA